MKSWRKGGGGPALFGGLRAPHSLRPALPLHPQQLQTVVQYFIFGQKWANLKKNESWLVFVLNRSNTLGNMFSAKIGEIFGMP